MFGEVHTLDCDLIEIFRKHGIDVKRISVVGEDGLNVWKIKAKFREQEDDYLVVDESWC